MALFRQKGIEQTSVDEIAERAGFSRATYFNHFGTKEGVLRYYGQRLQERMEELLAEAAPDASPVERIREMLLAMAREADRCSDDLKFVYLHSLRDPEYFARPTPARQRVFKMVCDLVAEAQRGGEIRGDLSAERNRLSPHVAVQRRGAGGGFRSSGPPAPRFDRPGSSLSMEFVVEIRRLGELARADAASFGSKGANLGELIGLGLPVPPGFAVAASVYADHAERCGLTERPASPHREARLGWRARSARARSDVVASDG